MYKDRQQENNNICIFWQNDLFNNDTTALQKANEMQNIIYSLCIITELGVHRKNLDRMNHIKIYTNIVPFTDIPAFVVKNKKKPTLSAKWTLTKIKAGLSTTFKNR